MKIRMLICTLLLLTSVICFADECALQFSTVSQTNYFKKSIKIDDDITVEGGRRLYFFTGEDINLKPFIGKAVKKHSGKTFVGETFDDAIEAVFKNIESKNLSPLAKSDAFASFAKEINPGLEAMIAKFPEVAKDSEGFLLKWQARREAVDKVKTIKYQMVEKIGMLEEFKRADFKTVSSDEFLITKGTNEEVLTHMGIHEYEKYVDSYVHWKKAPDSAGAKLFKDIDQGSLGILSIHDIRDVNSYNLWPMYLKEHDMRHIHYGMSHPMALATVMQSTRSKSSLRYTMMGGLYEGVDRIQYSHESKLNRWFSNQAGGSKVLNINRNLDLEESLMTLGLASQADLKAISKATGSWIDMKRFVNDLKGWTPKVVEGSSVNGKSFRGGSFKEDINEMLVKFSQRNEKAEILRKELLEKSDKVLTEEEIHFMKMQNFQINPENPEIVIDGLRFKNDGRGHYSGSDNINSPLGLGDN